MRRPGALCGCDGAGDCCLGGGGGEPGAASGGRLSRVKRLLLGRRSEPPAPPPAVNKAFGVPLHDMLAEPSSGAPAVLARLVHYIEGHGPQCGVLFRPCAGNPKLAERLRSQLESNGDADLEAAGDPATVAQLLRLWLRELPQPLLPNHTATALLRAHEKITPMLEDLNLGLVLPKQTRSLQIPCVQCLSPCFDCVDEALLSDADDCSYISLITKECHPELQGESSAWRELSSAELRSLPAVQLRSLSLVLRLCAPRPHTCRHLPPAAALAPLIIRGEPGHAPAAAALLATLAADFAAADNRLLDHAIQVTVGGPDLHIYPGSIQRKRKDRHDSFSLECKVIRSNSEERPLENSSNHCKDATAIRRVSSHEDFSLTHCGHSKSDTMGHSNCVVRVGGLPLHERNSVASTGGHQKHHQQQHPTVIVAAPPTAGSEAAVPCPAPLIGDLDLSDNEHERRRSSERFSRSAVPRPARARRPRHRRNPRHSPGDDAGSSSKENEEERGSSRSPLVHASSGTAHYNSSEDEADAASSRSSSAHSILQLHSHSQERERSPSPPLLDLSRLHQQVGESEPQPSRRGSGGPGHLDPSVPPSPPHQHAEHRLRALNRQAHSLKKKLKQFEEDFQRENGYRPSHSDKMTDREMKKVCSELNKIRKDIKQIKEDPNNIDLLMDTSEPKSSSDVSFRHKPKSMEEMVQEVEKLLAEKRQQAGRPEKMEELSHEQALDEKVAVQKALLHMEGIFGRPVSKGDRDLVRPLYDRYRALKRLIVRSGSSKLKDSMSELATIHEHETMEFTSSPVPSVPRETETTRPALPVASETLWANLHSLPLSELLNQQRAAREEKKRLRRSLREIEEEFLQRTGRKLQKEDRATVESVYVAYKHVKAKLRLLEALVTKQT